MTQNNCIALLWTLRSFSARVLQAVIDSHGERKSTNPGDQSSNGWLNFTQKEAWPALLLFFFSYLLQFHRNTFNIPSSSQFLKTDSSFFFSYSPSLCKCLSSTKQILGIPLWVQTFESKTHIKFNCDSIIGQNTSHNDISEPEPNVFPLSIDQVNYRKAFTNPLLIF